MEKAKARAGAVKQLGAFLNAQRADDWTLAVGKFITGQVSETDFLISAHATDPAKDNKQHCEAFCYAGLLRELNGDKAGAPLPCTRNASPPASSTFRNTRSRTPA